MKEENISRAILAAAPFYQQPPPLRLDNDTPVKDNPLFRLSTRSERESFPAAAASQTAGSSRRGGAVRTLPGATTTTMASRPRVRGSPGHHHRGAKVKAAKASVTRWARSTRWLARHAVRDGDVPARALASLSPELEAGAVTSRRNYFRALRARASPPSQRGCRRRTSLGIPYGWRVPRVPPPPLWAGPPAAWRHWHRACALALPPARAPNSARGLWFCAGWTVGSACGLVLFFFYEASGRLRSAGA